MRKSTFTKTALTLMALGVFASGAMAVTEGESPSADVQYQLTLAPYIKITSTGNKASTVSFGDNYGSISIDEPMAGSFTVISNAATRDIYLRGTNTVNNAKALYAVAENPAALHLIFTKVGGVATVSDVTDAAKASPSQASNKDTISFAITGTPSHAESPDSGISPAWDNANKQVVYTMTNGTGTFPFTISGNADPSTFSTHDSAGTYQATLTLTSVALE